MNKTPKLMIIGSESWTDANQVNELVTKWWKEQGSSLQAQLIVSDQPSGASRMAQVHWPTIAFESDGTILPVIRFNHDEHADETALYQAMVDAEPDAIMLFSTDGDIQKWLGSHLSRLAYKSTPSFITQVAAARTDSFPVAIEAPCCEGKDCGTTQLFLSERRTGGGSIFEYRRQANGDVYGEAADVIRGL